MPRFITTEDLIAEVRSLVDEDNNSTISDTTDILPSLTRAQNYAFNILARHYEDPLLVYQDIAVTGGVKEIDLPENMFEDRLERVEFYSSAGFYYEVKRISYRDISAYESSTTVDVPPCYVLYGRKLRFPSPPNGSYNMRIWYLREPDTLVKPQGRVTKVGGDYIVVNVLGDDVDTIEDALGNYINIIDGQTGEYKQSLQVNSVTGNKLTFRSIPTRTTVLNRTISTSIDADVEIDDYICLVKGSCVPFFLYPIHNFLIQHAVAEMKRKIGSADTQLEEQLKREFEKQVEHSWVGREQTLRVKSRSRAFKKK